MLDLIHKGPFEHLWRAKQENRLPHGILLSGVKGTFKAKFADIFARALLCQAVTPKGESCGQCHACHLIAGRVHPNIVWIEPEKPGAAIKIDQIRQASEFIQQTSAQGEYRIVIIHPADEMNVHAANALLKSLEEPSPGALLILINDQKSRLPATVLSRCQRVVFLPPDQTQMFAWMSKEPTRQDLFQALIMLAESKGDPIQSAHSLQNTDLTQLLDFFLTWIVDLLKLQLNSESSRLINHDYLQDLAALRSKTQLGNNVKLLERIQQIRSEVCAGVNFNKLLLLESIFVQWMECV